LSSAGQGQVKHYFYLIHRTHHLELWTGPSRRRFLRDKRHIPVKWRINTDAISESHKGKKLFSSKCA
jgi:hypothetical protein